MRDYPERYLRGAMGYSLPDARFGVHAAVFYDRMETVSKTGDVSLRDTQANLSVAATRARLFGGSKALWPLSGVMMSSASGHSRWSAHALSMGQTTS